MPEETRGDEAHEQAGDRDGIRRDAERDGRAAHVPQARAVEEGVELRVDRAAERGVEAALAFARGLGIAHALHGHGVPDRGRARRQRRERRAHGLALDQRAPERGHDARRRVHHRDASVTRRAMNRRRFGRHHGRDRADAHDRGRGYERGSLGCGHRRMEPRDRARDARRRGERGREQVTKARGDEHTVRAGADGARDAAKDDGAAGHGQRGGGGVGGIREVDDGGRTTARHRS